MPNVRQSTRQPIWAIVFALLALRVIVGLHFYNEGVTKLKSENFSSAPFLRMAKGPFADHFHRLIDDYDGHQRLCIEFGEDSTDSRPRINTQLTTSIWKDFVSKAVEQADANDETKQLAIRKQNESIKWLDDFMVVNGDKIIAWAGEANRSDGSMRDGLVRKKTVQGVESLNDQRNAVMKERAQVAAGWFVEIETAWDHLEASINDLLSNESTQGKMELSRPFSQPNSKQAWIDRCLPWFDAIVGGLLIIGLFTRFASLAGIALLLGVVMTQPFWVRGTESTFYQWIEIGALLVLMASAAGQFAGLDYFFGRRNKNVELENPNSGIS